MIKQIKEEKLIDIGKGEIVSFGRGDYTVNCIRGVLWITWPGSGDMILKAGDELSVKMQGKLCITSLDSALVSIRKKAAFTGFREITGLAALRFIKSDSCITDRRGRRSAADLIP